MQFNLEQGNVYYFPKFLFKNGGQSDKLIVLLTKKSKLNELLIFCVATSKQGFRRKEYGCNPEKAYFFIPKERDSFYEDTWLILENLHSYTPAQILQFNFDKKLERKWKLKDENLKALINCIRKLVDIEEIYRDCIV